MLPSSPDRPRAGAGDRGSGHGDRLPLVLGLAFAGEVLLLGWSPADRETWVLENLIAIPLAVVLVVRRRRLALSSGSWCLVFAFLAIHEIGSHFTYSQVPWIEWASKSLPWTLEVERNHFDRFVHLLFGLLCFRALRELLADTLDRRPAVVHALAVCVVVTLSSLYELAEAAVAWLFEPGTGMAFVGAQGDIWDAQKDMALALGGALVAAAFEWRRFRIRSQHAVVRRVGLASSAPSIQPVRPRPDAPFDSRSSSASLRIRSG